MTTTTLNAVKNNPQVAIKKIASNYQNWKIDSTTATHNIRERWLSAKQLDWIFNTCSPSTPNTGSIGKTEFRYDVIGADFETITVYLRRTNRTGHIIGRVVVKDFRY